MQMYKNIIRKPSIITLSSGVSFVYFHLTINDEIKAKIAPKYSIYKDNIILGTADTSGLNAGDRVLVYSVIDPRDPAELTDGDIKRYTQIAFYIDNASPANPSDGQYVLKPLVETINHSVSLNYNTNNDILLSFRTNTDLDIYDPSNVKKMIENKFYETNDFKYMTLFWSHGKIYGPISSLGGIDTTLSAGTQINYRGDIVLFSVPRKITSNQFQGAIDSCFGDTLRDGISLSNMNVGESGDIRDNTSGEIINAINRGNKNISVADPIGWGIDGGRTPYCFLNCVKCDSSDSCENCQACETCNSCDLCQNCNTSENCGGSDELCASCFSGECTCVGGCITCQLCYDCQISFM